jgi:DNA-binding transcriptional LysR family regulator
VTRVVNFELEAAFVAEPFTAPSLEARHVFEERLVLVTSRAICKVSGPADLGRSTLIAFAQGCSYRKRTEEWLGSANVMPERIMEFESYQAMIACVAAGTGFAVVPKSVLETLRPTKSVCQHALPKRFSRNRTYIVWRGDPSPSLRCLLSLLVTAAV